MAELRAATEADIALAEKEVSLRGVYDHRFVQNQVELLKLNMRGTWHPLMEIQLVRMVHAAATLTWCAVHDIDPESLKKVNQ